jgi:hypothetical protein
VVIDYLDFMSVAIPPNKADAILVIDSYRVLASPVMSKRVQFVVWRNRKVLQFAGGIDHPKLSTRDFHDARRESFGAFPVKDRFGGCVTEASDHLRPGKNVSLNDTHGKQNRNMARSDRRTAPLWLRLSSAYKTPDLRIKRRRRRSRSTFEFSATRHTDG